MIYIPKLIRNTLSISYYPVYVTMRMAINPIIYSAISNEVPQLCCESTVYRTSLKNPETPVEMMEHDALPQQYALPGFH